MDVISGMSDRQIAEETLAHLRGFAQLMEMMGPMLIGMQDNPAIKMLMRMSG